MAIIDYNKLIRDLAEARSLIPVGPPDSQAIPGDVNYYLNGSEPGISSSEGTTPYEIAAALSAPAEGPNAWLENAKLAGAGNPMDTRINALNRTYNEQGIMASKDAKGQLVLSDYKPSLGVDPVAQVRTNSGNGFTGGIEGITGSVRDIINQLKTTTDIDTARSLQAQLNEAHAMETSKLTAQARIHAENKLGVPQLELNLNKMIGLDRASPSYFEHGGADSQVTAQARSQLNAQRSAADLEAQRYLSSNVSMNGLNAAIKTASMETARISRISDRKEQLTATSDQRRVEKESIIQLRLEETAKGLSEETKAAIRILNPVLASAAETDLAANFEKGKANPAYIAAVTAPREDIPKLAAQGNSFSTALLLTRENEANIPPEITKARLAEVQAIMKEGLSSRLKAQIASTVAPGPDKAKEVDSIMASLTAKPTGTAADRAQSTDYKFRAAMSIVNQGITARFIDNVTGWNSPDPELAEAVAKAKAVANKTNLSEVATAYIGDATGPEINNRLEALIRLMEGQARLQKDSAFGAPDTMRIGNMLRAEQFKRGRAARLEATPFSGSSLGIFN